MARKARRSSAPPRLPFVAGAALALIASAPASDSAWSAPPPAVVIPAGEASPAPTGAAGDAAFLSLASHDVERAGANAAERPKVGDAVELRVAGVEAAQAAPAPGGESLTDQGWELLPAEGAPVAGEFRFRAVPLKPGALTLPSLALQDASGRAVARTNPFGIEIQSAVLPDDPKPAEPADLRPPVSLRFPWWVIAVGALLFAGLVWVGVAAYRRRRARLAPHVSAKPVEPPKPEDEVALSALAELERASLPERGQFKAHYFRLSEILKAYLGARYRFDAAESTTRELVLALEERRLLDDSRLRQVERLFGRLDLVKFTDHVPEPAEGRELLASARELVQLTRRPPPIVAPAGASKEGG